MVAWSRVRVSGSWRGNGSAFKRSLRPNNKGKLRATESSLCGVFSLSTPQFRIGLRPQALWSCHNVIYKKSRDGDESGAKKLSY